MSSMYDLAARCEKKKQKKKKEKEKRTKHENTFASVKGLKVSITNLVISFYIFFHGENRP